MVAILLPQPDEPARGPAPQRSAGALAPACHHSPYPRPVDLATVEPIPLRSVPRALPDRLRASGGAAWSPFSWLSPCSPPPPRAGRALLERSRLGRALLAATGRCPGLVTAGGDVRGEPGDTLWSIAAAIAPTLIPGRWWTRSATPTAGPDLQVGERLVVRLD